MNKLNLKSLPRLKDSISYLYIERGVIERDDKSICVFDETGKTQIPVAIVTLLMLGPGTKISHAAIQTTAATGCLICWVGEESVRFYAAGMGETRSASFLIKQAQLVSNRESRIAVARAMYSMRFEGPVAPNLTIDQLRGKEGARVRDIYLRESKKYGVPWNGRSYNRNDWDCSDNLNKALSSANACLYGVCHAAIVSLGLSPGLGFIHVGKQLSFVYDIADLYKAELTIPVSFEMAASGDSELERAVRLRLRDAFREQKIMDRIANDIFGLLKLAEEQGDRFANDSAAPGELMGDDTAIVGGVNRGSDSS